MRPITFVNFCLIPSAHAAPAEAVVIPMPGAGAVASDYLVRNLESFKRAGLGSVVTASPTKHPLSGALETAGQRSKGERPAPPPATATLSSAP